MGRWKGSPQGPYWDPNDTGPNQVDPPPGASPNGPQAPMGAPQMPPQPGGMDPNALPGTYTPWSESMPDGMGGSYNPGGHVDANGNPLPGPPPLDTSGWARKQYPGGVGGPVTPMDGSLGSLGGMTKTAPPSLAQMGGWAKPSGQTGGTISSLMNGGNLAGTGSAFGALFGKR